MWAQPLPVRGVLDGPPNVGPPQCPFAVNVQLDAGFVEGSNPSVSCQIPADAGSAGTRTAAAVMTTVVNTRNNDERMSELPRLGSKPRNKEIRFTSKGCRSRRHRQCDGCHAIC
ncbi:hypothetical protein GCM10018952_62370 [Streptosporangium vulgare]